MRMRTKNIRIMTGGKKSNKLKKGLLITGIAVLALLAVMFTIATVITSVNMDKNFGRGAPDPKMTFDNFYEYYASDYPRVEVNFKSGENTLKGFIYGAENDKALLVFAHGIGNCHENYMKNLVWFVDRGWRVFTYDATGSGQSEGEGTMGLPQSALDLNEALNFAENDERLSGLPVYLMGHSWGGYAVTAVLNFDHDIKGVASVSGYNEPVEMIYERASSIVGKFRPMIFPSIWLYNKLRFGKNSGLSAVDGINKSNVPVLIFHGTNDKTVHYDESAIINHRDEITNPNVEFVVLEGFSHSGIFDIEEAREYENGEFARLRQALIDKYNGDVPDEEFVKFYANADRELMNAPNEEFLNKVEEFFLSAK